MLLYGLAGRSVAGDGYFLRALMETLPVRSKAIVVVSGHWEEADVTVNSASAPSLLFDYYGFPEHTYKLRYDALGSPELAARVRTLLSSAGIETGEEPARGFVHGVFIPLMLVNPSADLPIVQLSLGNGLDPPAHLAAGRALSPLRDEGALIVGSGMSYHNMRGFGPEFAPASDAFDRWLTEAVTEQDPAKRDALLIEWAAAPEARIAHPREEHLLPLMVSAGAANADVGQKIFEGRIPHTTVSAFRFG